MAFDAVARGDTIIEIEPRDWGREILQEVLFRAAQACSAAAGPPGPVRVTLQFDITADEHQRSITITAPGAIEKAIVTTVVL